MGQESLYSGGICRVLFVSQKIQVTHLLVICYLTALTPSGAPKNICSHSENAPTVLCVKMFAISFYWGKYIDQERKKPAESDILSTVGK